MIDHLGIPVGDIAASRRFYEAALAPLGYKVMGEETNGLGNNVVLMGVDEVDFVIADGEPVSDGVHHAFRAESRAAVDAFHAAALATGGRDNGAPGIREDYHPNYYAAFAIDPDGMNVEAVCHKAE
ncbi:VOC family protein [Sphingomonas sp. BT-65]|uniref:VOC family protein n=1 Tax=Sphingomonas sp. BT-65 TaxID=2989821 RepID=UPI002235A28B|nr:VOC family protein [Sphingomonas sp. BT-65]MCW4460378.1 VOC family protein [Sphingomonas sp. BT-65]